MCTFRIFLTSHKHEKGSSNLKIGRIVKKNLTRGKFRYFPAKEAATGLSVIGENIRMPDIAGQRRAS